MPVEYERHGRVAVITVDRPERKNAIDEVTARGLGDAWRRLFADEEANVGELTGDDGTL